MYDDLFEYIAKNKIRLKNTLKKVPKMEVRYRAVKQGEKLEKNPDKYTIVDENTILLNPKNDDPFKYKDIKELNNKRFKFEPKFDKEKTIRIETCPKFNINTFIKKIRKKLPKRVKILYADRYFNKSFIKNTYIIIADGDLDILKDILEKDKKFIKKVIKDQTLEEFLYNLRFIKKEKLKEFENSYFKFCKISSVCKVNVQAIDTLQCEKKCIMDIIIDAMMLIKELQNREIPENYKQAHEKNMETLIEAMTIYFRSVVFASESNIKEFDKKRVIMLESSLFNMAFSFEKDEKNKLGYNLTIYPVYLKHDEFTRAKDPFILLNSSTGSGKTRCTPLFFLILNLLSNKENKTPYFIMTQPSKSISIEKKKDLDKLLFGIEHINVITKYNEMLKKYKSQKNDEITIGIFSPQILLSIIRYTKEYDIFNKTRFCFDEIHQRTVMQDALIAVVSQNKKENITDHVTLMSATPDEKIAKCFKGIKTIELKNAGLFKVSEEEETIQIKTDADKIVIQQIEKIVNLIVKTDKLKENQEEESENDQQEEKLEHGHILAFLPSNIMIEKVKRGIFEIFNKKKEDEAQKFAVFQINEEPKQKIIENLNNFVHENEDKTVILPIKVAGYTPLSNREIARDELKDGLDDKVIKIVCATNSLESSITIHNLAAIVDSSLHNVPIIDKEKGIQEMKLDVITKQMQAQRRGRVGRTRPGKYFKIVYENLEFSDSIKPEILTNDLSWPIIELRGERIGINLEELEGLPDKPPNINETLNELRTMNILDRNNVLTDTGKKLSMYYRIEPLYSASIENAAKDDFERLCGAFFVLLFTKKNLFFTNSYLNHDIDDIYCRESDIITIARLFIKFLSENKEEVIMNQYFNLIIYKDILYSFKSICKNFKQNSNEFWEKLKQELNNARKCIEFINKILKNVFKIKKTWESSHIVVFEKISRVSSIPFLVYKCKNNNSNDLIHCYERPFSRGYSTPKNVLIIDLIIVEETKMLYGSMIHSFTLPEEEEYEVPYFIEEHKMCDSPLFKYMLNEKLYMKNQNQFIPIEQKLDGKNTEIFTIETIENKAIISFIPKNKESKEKFENAVKAAKSLLPFAGNSILIQYFDLDIFEKDIIAAVEIYSYYNEYKTKVYSIEKGNNKLPKCYPLNAKTIDFLKDHLEYLENNNNECRIALTSTFYGLNLSKKLKASPSKTFSVFNCRSNENQIIIMVDADSDINKNLGSTIKWNGTDPDIRELIIADAAVKKVNSICPNILYAKILESVFTIKLQNNAQIESSLLSKAEKYLESRIDERVKIKQKDDIINVFFNTLDDPISIGFYKNELLPSQEFMKKISQEKNKAKVDYYPRIKINFPDFERKEPAFLYKTNVNKILEKAEEFKKIYEEKTILDIPSFYYIFDDIIEEIKNKFNEENIYFFEYYYGIKRRKILINKKDQEKCQKLASSIIENSNIISIDVPPHISKKNLYFILKKLLKGQEENKRVHIFNSKLTLTKEMAKDCQKEFDKISKKNETDIIGCFNYCEDPKLSNRQNYITLYHKDREQSVTNNFCVDCIRNNFDFVLSELSIDRPLLLLGSIKLFDKKAEDNNPWPRAPIGQVFMALAREESLNGLVKKWLIAVVKASILRDDNFTFCPKHPERIVRKPNEDKKRIFCKVAGCDNVFCQKCKEWHPKNDSCYEKLGADIKICPQCHSPISKIKGCNMMKCSRCNSFFCYLCCDVAYQTCAECYKHLFDKHQSFV